MEAIFKKRLTALVVVGMIAIALTGYFAIGAGVDLFNMILNGAPMQYRNAALMGLFLLLLNALFFYASVLTAKINKYREEQRKVQYKEKFVSEFDKKLQEVMNQRKVLRGEDGGIL